MDTINLKAEESALKLFKRASQKLYDERIDEAYVDLLRVVRGYPDTHMAFKAMFLLCILCKTVLYSEVLITDAFVTAVRVSEKNPITDMFNKDLKTLVSKYQLHFEKRRKAFDHLKSSIKDLLRVDKTRQYPEVYMYVTLSQNRLKGCDPLRMLEKIKEGKVIPERELLKIIRDLYYYILVTVLSDDFDIEYTDDLSSLTKNKLNRVDFYHSMLNWLNQFYCVQKDFETSELMHQCSAIILGMTDDSTDRRRQDAFEILSKITKSYYSMACSIEKIKETEFEDVEDRLYAPVSLAKPINECSLMELVSMDETTQTYEQLKVMRSMSPMICLELDINQPADIMQLQETLESQPSEAINPNDFSSKIEFD